MAKIFPSLIAADLMNLRAEIEALNPHCEGYHLDVMDNHFVPNLTWGAQFINAIAKTTSRPALVHLMVDDPTNWIEKFTLPAHSSIEIHVESAGQTRKNLQRIRDLNLSPGIVINPKTEIEVIFPYLDLVDSVLLMSVEPGFSGQAFIPKVIEKIEPLVGYRETKGLKFEIGMDGGIGKENIADLTKRRIDFFGVGSGIFGQPNRVKALKELQQLAITSQ